MCVTKVIHDVTVQFVILRELASWSFMMDMNFSDLLPDFLEDNFSRKCVSKTILDCAEARPKTLGWKIFQKASASYHLSCLLGSMKHLSRILLRSGRAPTIDRIFEAWSIWRNGVYKDDPVPGDILTSCNAVALNKWLSLFVIEARKQNGTDILKTIDMLLGGLKRHMKEINPSSPNFLSGILCVFRTSNILCIFVGLQLPDASETTYTSKVFLMNITSTTVVNK